jgi:hypothetical protein
MPLSIFHHPSRKRRFDGNIIYDHVQLLPLLCRHPLDGGKDGIICQSKECGERGDSGAFQWILGLIGVVTILTAVFGY